jgi:hypothetical protein
MSQNGMVAAIRLMIMLQLVRLSITRGGFIFLNGQGAGLLTSSIHAHGEGQGPNQTHELAEWKKYAPGSAKKLTEYVAEGL